MVADSCCSGGFAKVSFSPPTPPPPPPLGGMMKMMWLGGGQGGVMGFYSNSLRSSVGSWYGWLFVEGNG